MCQLTALKHTLSLQRLNVLESSEDERRVQEILARLKVEVSCRRLLLYPYFRDFDRVSHYAMFWCSDTGSRYGSSSILYTWSIVHCSVFLIVNQV